MATTLHTVGHGALRESRFVHLLREAGIACVVDVRRAPGSRRHPQFNRAALEETLRAADLDYRWDERLGGRRSIRPDSPHRALDETLRGYADHIATAEFQPALDELLSLAAIRPTTVLCAEGDPSHCHRSLLSDAASLLRGARVLHLRHDGTLHEHRCSPLVRVTGNGLVYDRGTGPSLFV